MGRVLSGSGRAMDADARRWAGRLPLYCPVCHAPKPGARWESIVSHFRMVHPDKIGRLAPAGGLVDGKAEFILIPGWETSPFGHIVLLAWPWEAIRVDFRRYSVEWSAPRAGVLDAALSQV